MVMRVTDNPVGGIYHSTVRDVASPTALPNPECIAYINYPLLRLRS